MVRKILRKTIEDLPVWKIKYGLTRGDLILIHELALITFKPNVLNNYFKQEMGGVLGRNQDCSIIYFARNLLLEKGLPHAFVGMKSDMDGEDYKLIPVSDIESYETLKLKP
ncbi:MAG: hypothetical protein PHO02_00325 [Candidatus Nanoarchaeia archaeon]|nr:hypothetical protein [Candidatus Nanoarchaeia archaeon]